MSIVVAAAEGVSLRELLPEAEFRGGHDIVAFRCTSQPRTVRPGDIFVALPNNSHKLGDLLAEALQRGCGAVVQEPPGCELPVPQCLVSDAREALGRICHALAGNPSQRLKLIGVAGSLGKTTTCWLIAGVLSAAGYKSGLAGTLGHFDGLNTFAADDWKLQPDQLAALLARMVRHGCTHAVLEASPEAIAHSQIAGTQFDTVCITNLAADHRNEPPPNKRRCCPKNIFRYLAPEGLAVVNADDPLTGELLRHFDGPALTVAIEAPAEIGGVLLEQCSSEQTFLLTAGNEAVPVRTPMIGIHHVYNCLEAAAVGLAYGIDLALVARGLESVRHVPGRLERIECGQPFAVFVDCASSPQALRAALQTLRGVTQGRLICLLGTAEHGQCPTPRLLAKVADELADLLVITSSQPDHQTPQTTIDELLSGVRRRSSAVVVVERRAAIHWALAQARPGDTVLLEGTGHGGFWVSSDQIACVDDRAIARQWLYTVQPYCTYGSGLWY